MSTAKTLTYKGLISRLKKKQSFTFTRWGDGEWNCLFQDTKSKSNCDNHTYFPELGNELKRVLAGNPEYFLGIQSLAMREKGHKIQPFLDENMPEKRFGDADILHKASIKGKISEFFNGIKESERVVLVSPDYLKSIYKHIRFDAHVSVPQTDCWNNWKNIQHITQRMINRYKQKSIDNIVVLFVASMASNVIIDNLYSTNKGVTLIDAGSVFDPFVGNNIRSYHSNIDLIEKNNLA